MTSLSLLAGAAFGQGVIFEDQTSLAYCQAQEAVEALAHQSSLRFTIDVTESPGALKTQRYGLVTGSIVLPSIWKPNAPYFEFSEYSSKLAMPQNLLRQVVADGSRFYIYDAATRTYTVDTYSGPQRISQFFKLMNRATSSGPVSLFGRLVSQTYEGRYPKFTPWIRGAYGVPTGKKSSTITFTREDRFGGEESIAFNSPLQSVMYTSRPFGNSATGPFTSWNMGMTWNGASLLGYSFTPPLGAKLATGS